MQEKEQEKSIKFSPIKDRVHQFIKNQGINPNKFYNKTGITRGVLTQKNGISEQNISKFLDTFPKINPAWLLTGKEPMRLEEEEKPSAVSDPAPVYKGVPAASVNIIEINPQAAKTNTLIADVHASAGFGSLMESTKALEQLPAIHLPNAPGGLNVAFQINGDSMHPTIRHLDFVAGNQINDVNDVKDGYTYIIVEDTDGVLCKRLYRLGEDWQIVSDNPVYPPYNRAKNRILGIFKAFCRWSYDFRNYHDDVRADIQQLKTDIQQLKGKK